LLAKEDQFIKFILNECLKQKHGDYNVYIRDIISAYKGLDKYKSSMANLEMLIGQIKPLVGGNEPLIFYPRAETIEDQLQAHPEARTSEVLTESPIGVIQPPPTVWNPPLSLNGYRINLNGAWVYAQNVDEEFAGENDVFVFGSDENVELYDSGARVDGGAEFTGLIQVTDLNAIEHWTSGKLEFKVVVISASGTEVSVRKFEKTKRKYFRDKVWHDFNHSLGNWHKALLATG
jgi:hypothetical protein